MDLSQRRKKAVNWTSQENNLLIELFLDSYDTYYFTFSDGSKRGVKAVRESLHERWAEQLTRLGVAERTPIQVAEKIKKCIINTRKYINNNSESSSAGRSDDLSPYLRPLEQKLREEYSKQSNGYRFDISSDDGPLTFFDLLKDVKEESMSSKGVKCGDSLDGELDAEPSTSNVIDGLPLDRLSHMAALTHALDPPVAPVTPFQNFSLLPPFPCKNKRRSFEEVPEELVAKRRRLLDAELELVERKRYLTEMKIKYWESKTKKLDSS
ncbi:unnamed protein product [Heligmosomoides polygyrus]|uniref:Myb_DNA-bind_5 domain-containing protein n=1 Tax=Heligmosomoides polygyrus TaxID=6339 RepID=A0A3P8G9R5_HELPZ|nr:unnamed protein product [Heligmosomoides polygyrus]